MKYYFINFTGLYMCTYKHKCLHKQIVNSIVVKPYLAKFRINMFSLQNVPCYIKETNSNIYNKIYQKKKLATLMFIKYTQILVLPTYFVISNFLNRDPLCLLVFFF